MSDTPTDQRSKMPAATFSQKAAAHRLLRPLKWLGIGLFGCVLLAAGFVLTVKFVWMPWKYPYGWSHSCDKGLSLLLWLYADDHDGNFPAGEITPEASLSLLSRPPYNANAELLRGKTVPREVVEGILSRGELLDPDSCGWHYVEGLRKDDDGRLALFWDKAGLGHNGERLANGERIVMRIHGGHDRIPASEWPQFLEEQKQLLQERDRKRQATE